MRLIYLGKGKGEGDSFYPIGQLMSQGNKAQGFAGCNPLMGGYELKGEYLTFGRMASTRRACQNGKELETSFMLLLYAWW